MTGVGEVEHIVFLLRIEHEGILVALLQHRDKAPAHNLRLLLVALHSLRHLTVGVGEFNTKDGKCAFKVLFLEYGIGAQCAYECHNYDSKYSFHCLYFDDF